MHMDLHESVKTRDIYDLAPILAAREGGLSYNFEQEEIDNSVNIDDGSGGV